MVDQVLNQGPLVQISTSLLMDHAEDIQDKSQCLFDYLVPQRWPYMLFSTFLRIYHQKKSF